MDGAGPLPRPADPVPGPVREGLAPILQAPILQALILQRVRARAAGELQPQADAIDRDGLYPTGALRGFGADGAYALHLAAHTPLPAPSLWAAIEVMAAIGAVCMSSAFCAWCQDACGWYLENTGNARLRDRLQPGIATGATLGATGLSNPVKALSGLEPFNLRGLRVPGGWQVSGVLPWVSNLGEGHLFGTIFENAADPAHRVMGMFRCGDPGVTIRQSAHFVALEGTGTFAIRMKDAFIGEDDLLADPLGDMAKRIRPGFILLQTGMGFGVIDGCVAAMGGPASGSAASNRFLPDGPDELADRAAALRGTVAALAATPHDPAPDYLRRVLEARLAVSELTLAATQSAVLHAGARGYLLGSAVHRRQREGVFVAIITPSIRHLRQELAALPH